jgi:hypothetical protein
MLRRVALVRTDVSENVSDAIFTVTTIGELGTTFLSPSVLTRATRRNIPEDRILNTNVCMYVYMLVPSPLTVFQRFKHRTDHDENCKVHAAGVQLRLGMCIIVTAEFCYCAERAFMH